MCGKQVHYEASPFFIFYCIKKNNEKIIKIKLFTDGVSVKRHYLMTKIERAPFLSWKKLAPLNIK